jgi:hypothetical protein
MRTPSFFYTSSFTSANICVRLGGYTYEQNMVDVLPRKGQTLSQIILVYYYLLC